MGKIKIVIAALLVTGLVVAAIFFIIGFVGPKNAGILVNTEPSSIIFINNEQVGRTPYEQTRDAGEITLKLVPESDKPLAPYELKVNLTSGAKTIIQRTFEESDEKTSGVVVSFEKEGEKTSSISVVSEPDSAEVRIDGRVVGFAPNKTNDVSVGSHTISVSSDSYEEKSLEVNTYEGYKLTAVFKLRKSDEKPMESPTPTPQVKEEEKKVKILETDVGFLRVRSEPSTLANEVFQVKPGEEYILLDKDEKTGWFKIEYEEDGQKSEGWISNQYAQEVNGNEDVVKSSPSPSGKPKEN